MASKSSLGTAASGGIPPRAPSRRYSAAQKKADQEEAEDWGGSVTRSATESSALGMEIRRSMSTFSTTMTKSKGGLELMLDVFGCGFLCSCCRGRSGRDNDDSDSSDDDDDYMISRSLSFAGGFWGNEGNMAGFASQGIDVGHLQTRGASKFEPTPGYLEKVRERARHTLDLGEEAAATRIARTQPRTRWGRFRRLLDLREIQIQIEMKRIRAKVEPPPSRTAYSMVQSMNFEVVVGVLIMLNSVTLAIESMYGAEEKPAFLNPLEHVFTFAFLMEWAIRLRALTWVWLIDPANLFDTLLVWGAGVMVNWVLVPAGVDADVLHNFASLRILRLTRLCRMVRMMPQFHDLWMLIYGITGCLRLMFWAMIILGFVHWGFAVAVMETLAKSETFEQNPHVQELFANQATTMFTLFQIMTFDDWAQIVRPITDEMPLAAGIFFPFMGMAGILLTNVMTAVVIQRVFKSTDKEALDRKKEIARWKNVTALFNAFQEMDTDGSGRVSEEEFSDILDNVNFVRMMKVIDIDIDELPDIFHILNEGMGGSIALDEFITGVMRLQGPSLSRDMLKGSSRISKVNEGFTALDETTERQCTSIQTWSEDLDKNHEEYVEMQVMVAEILEELETIGMREASRKGAAILPRVDIDVENMPIPKNEMLDSMGKSTDVHRADMVKTPPQKWVRTRYNLTSDNGGQARVESMRIEMARRKSKRESEVRKTMGPQWDELEITDVLNAADERHIAIKRAKVLGDKKLLAKLTKEGAIEDEEPAITAMIPFNLVGRKESLKAATPSTSGDEAVKAPSPTSSPMASTAPGRFVATPQSPQGGQAGGARPRRVVGRTIKPPDPALQATLDIPGAVLSD